MNTKKHTLIPCLTAKEKDEARDRLEDFEEELVAVWGDVIVFHGETTLSNYGIPCVWRLNRGKLEIRTHIIKNQVVWGSIASVSIERVLRLSQCAGDIVYSLRNSAKTERENNEKAKLEISGALELLRDMS